MLANDTDPDGDTATITAIPGAGQRHRDLTGGGTVYLHPGRELRRHDTFTYTITDGRATDTATVTVTVTNVNDAPTAVDDAATVGRGLHRRRHRPLLANDTDPDGDAPDHHPVTSPPTAPLSTTDRRHLHLHPQRELRRPRTPSPTPSPTDRCTATPVTVTVTVEPGQRRPERGGRRRRHRPRTP